MNFSGQQKQVVKPPQRGIFPLDHDGDCKARMKDYLQCLDEEKSSHYKCRDLSRAYLQCRMDSKLMAKEDLDGVSKMHITMALLFSFEFIFCSILYF